MCRRLDGKVAVVTGAASGVGASAVSLFAAEGARLGAFGRVDVVFNNAGATIRGTLEETDDDVLDAALGVNLVGVVHMCRSAVPHMRAQGAGAIVNNASITALE